MIDPSLYRIDIYILIVTTEHFYPALFVVYPVFPHIIDMNHEDQTRSLSEQMVARCAYYWADISSCVVPDILW